MSEIADPLRVCMFGSEIAPSNGGVYIGGSVVSAVSLARHLDHTGCDVSVYTTRPRDWDTDEYESTVNTEFGIIRIANLNAKHLSTATAVVVVAKLTSGLIRHCRAHNVDIIHGHSGFPVVSLIPILAGKVLDIPVVHSLYCPVPEQIDGGLKQRLSSPFFTRQLMQQTVHTFAMSENIADSLRRAGVTDTTILRPIIDCETYRPDLSTPESVEIDEDRLTVLFVGNLKPEKGLEYLVEAVGKLSTPVQCIITTERDFEGSDERANEIERQIEHYNLEDHVEWVGIIPDMPKVISAADVLTVPFTNMDGPSDYPLAALEAMAAQTPVVGTNIGGIAELLDEGRGYLAEPRDSDALAEALKSAGKMSEEDRERAREYVQTVFSADEVYSEVNRVYQRWT